jgi:hypothetical protein
LLAAFFPALRIPWSDVVSARTYEATGWVTPGSQPGTVFQAAYDPNYRGPFVELEVGYPPVYLQLPLSVIEEYVAAVPPPSPGDGA